MTAWHIPGKAKYDSPEILSTGRTPMPRAATYHRPKSLDEALTLLANPQHTLLAGGTVLNSDSDPTQVSMIDLQDLNLAGIAGNSKAVTIKAMTTLQDILEDAQIPKIVRQAAKKELPSTLRTLGTIGGTVVAGGSNSVMLAALLVHEARVLTIGPDGETDHLLSEILTNPKLVSQKLISGISIEIEGFSYYEGTGRTPADTPIVSATSRRIKEKLSVALTGIAKTPVLVDPLNPTADLNPPEDFRGSAKYRLHLASVLTERVTAATKVEPE